MTQNRPKAFFVHVQKAAGTSLVYRLRRLFDRSEIYPDASDGSPELVASVISVDHLRERWPHRRDQVRVLTGHFPLRAAELLGEPFETLTTLREPVERTLSYLRHHRKLTPADQDKSLEEIYEDPERYRTFVHNHMVKMFSLSPDEMGDGALTPVTFTPQRLDAAKANLATVDLIGLQEDYDAFWRAAAARFGWDLGKTTHANRTDPTDVPASFRRRIAEDNAMDVELYEHARALVAERAASGTP